MSDGFQVTMTGLQQAARVFRAEAGTFAAIMPSGGPASVDGGSAEINDALSLVLAAFGGLHSQLAAVIGGMRASWRPPTAPTRTPRTPTSQ
jgi:hypothetical protein